MDKYEQIKASRMAQNQKTGPNNTLLTGSVLAKTLGQRVNQQNYQRQTQLNSQVRDINQNISKHRFLSQESKEQVESRLGIHRGSNVFQTGQGNVSKVSNILHRKGQNQNKKLSSLQQDKTNDYKSEYQFQKKRGIQLISTCQAMDNSNQFSSMAQKNLENYNKLIGQFEKSYGQNRDYHTQYKEMVKKQMNYQLQPLPNNAPRPAPGTQGSTRPLQNEQVVVQTQSQMKPMSRFKAQKNDSNKDYGINADKVYNMKNFHQQQTSTKHSSSKKPHQLDKISQKYSRGDPSSLNNTRKKGEMFETDKNNIAKDHHVSFKDVLLKQYEQVKADVRKQGELQKYLTNCHSSFESLTAEALKNGDKSAQNSQQSLVDKQAIISKNSSMNDLGHVTLQKTNEMHSPDMIKIKENNNGQYSRGSSPFLPDKGIQSSGVTDPDNIAQTASDYNSFMRKSAHKNSSGRIFNQNMKRLQSASRGMKPKEQILQNLIQKQQQEINQEKDKIKDAGLEERYQDYARFQNMQREGMDPMFRSGLKSAAQQVNEINSNIQSKLHGKQINMAAINDLTRLTHTSPLIQEQAQQMWKPSVFERDNQRKNGGAVQHKFQRQNTNSNETDGNSHSYRQTGQTPINDSNSNTNNSYQSKLKNKRYSTQLDNSNTRSKRDQADSRTSSFQTQQNKGKIDINPQNTNITTSSVNQGSVEEVNSRFKFSQDQAAQLHELTKSVENGQGLNLKQFQELQKHNQKKRNNITQQQSQQSEQTQQRSFTNNSGMNKPNKDSFRQSINNAISSSIHGNQYLAKQSLSPSPTPKYKTKDQIKKEESQRYQEFAQLSSQQMKKNIPVVFQSTQGLSLQMVEEQIRQSGVSRTLQSSDQDKTEAKQSKNINSLNIQVQDETLTMGKLKYSIDKVNGNRSRLQSSRDQIKTLSTQNKNTLKMNFDTSPSPTKTTIINEDDYQEDKEKTAFQQKTLPKTGYQSREFLRKKTVDSQKIAKNLQNQIEQEAEKSRQSKIQSNNRNSKRSDLASATKPQDKQMQQLISENEAQEMCLKLLRNRQTHNHGKKERPKSGKWMFEAGSKESTLNANYQREQEVVVKEDGFNVSKLAYICTPEVIENFDYFTNGKSEAQFEQWQSIYTILKKVGEGSYANVRVALHKDLNERVAIKIYEKKGLQETNRRKNVKREIQIMDAINHESLITMFEAFESRKQVFVVMEYMNGGTLHSYMKKLKESQAQTNNFMSLERNDDTMRNVETIKDEKDTIDFLATKEMSPSRLLSTREGFDQIQESKWKLSEVEAKFLWQQVLFGVNYLHQRHIAHRDLKLENIMLDETSTRVKIIDFGFSTCLMPIDRKLKIVCGTPSYMAPEIVQKQQKAAVVAANSHNEEKGYKPFPADIWALGVLLYVLLSGKFPFKPPKVKLEMTKAQRNHQLFKNICKQDIPLHEDMPENISKEARQLLNKLFIKQPEHRPTTEQLINHPWLEFSVKEENELRRNERFSKMFDESMKFIAKLKNEAKTQSVIIKSAQKEQNQPQSIKERIRNQQK